jgi:hypothetical protein
MTEMATAQLSTYDHEVSGAAPCEDGVCVSSAMFGGACGALAGATTAAGSFEYAAVLFGTLGVVLGSVIAGTAGHYLVYPAYKALFCRHG